MPFAQEAVREAVQGALRTGGKRSVIDGRRVAQYVADIGVMDVRGGAGGYVLWSQEGLREAAKARQMRESEGKKSATKGGSPEEPAVSLVGEPMPPFVSGQWLPWAWLLQQMIEKSRESRKVAREREGEGEGDDGLYVVDGSETVHAVAVRREKDCEVADGGRGEGEGLGWDSGCGASGTEAWHEGLNDHLLMRWAGEQGRRGKGEGEKEREEEWRGVQASSVHQGTAVLGMLPLKLAQCHGKAEQKRSLPTGEADGSCCLEGSLLLCSV